MIKKILEDFMPHQYQLPQLPYSLDALEPVINKEIMNLHYNMHHATYVKKLNEALQQYEDASKKEDVAAMISIQQAIKFNGGGHVNHSIFWTNLAPKKSGGGEPPIGPLADAIKNEFGSLQKFIEIFSAKAIAIQGSGWCWLGYGKEKGSLCIVTCDNQDPLSTKNLVPLLGIDVWEHAYYLQYMNVRADYVKAIWQIINWKNVAERYASASGK